MVQATPQSPVLIYDLQPQPGACPYAQRSKIVLIEKGIPYTTQYINKESKPQKFLDFSRRATGNPNHRGTVPTIVDGPVELTESHVVSEYLDNAYPGPKLFPTDAKLLAKVRLFVELYTSEVLPNGYKILKAGSQAEAESAIQAFLAGLKVIDGFLKNHAVEGGDFLLGKDISYAEAATLPFVIRFKVTLPHYHNVDVLKLAAANGLHRVESWIKAGVSRPSVVESTLADETIISNWSKFVKPFGK